MPTNMSRLFAELLERFTDHEPTAVAAFAAGFMTGQAEKVWCGACKAAMFRPDTSQHDELLGEIIQDVAGQYGLFYERYVFAGEVEYWIASSGWWFLVDRLTEMKYDTPKWHLHRAALCGVSPWNVELDYHKQKV